MVGNAAKILNTGFTPAPGLLDLVLARDAGPDSQAPRLPAPRISAASRSAAPGVET